MPLQVLDSRPVSEKDEPHWLSRFTDHIETRPRWFRLAKPIRACASATVKFWPCLSFWPIITVAPSRCQICCERSVDAVLAGTGPRAARTVAFSAASASCRHRAARPGGALKSIVMTLTPAMETCSRSIASITDRALSCSPDGSTGQRQPDAEPGVGLLQGGDRRGPPLPGGDVVQRGALDVQVDRGEVVGADHRLVGGGQRGGGRAGDVQAGVRLCRRTTRWPAARPAAAARCGRRPRAAGRPAASV